MASEFGSDSELFGPDLGSDLELETKSPDSDSRKKRVASDSDLNPIVKVLSITSTSKHINQDVARK